MLFLSVDFMESVQGPDEENKVDLGYVKITKAATTQLRRV